MSPLDQAAPGGAGSDRQVSRRRIMAGTLATLGVSLAGVTPIAAAAEGPSDFEVHFPGFRNRTLMNEASSEMGNKQTKGRAGSLDLGATCAFGRFVQSDMARSKMHKTGTRN